MKSCAVLLSLLFIGLSTAPVRADQLAVLGTADTFAVLGASAITNTGATTIIGDIGLSSNASFPVSPFGPVSGGANHVNDAAAIAAQSDAANAYLFLSGLLPTQSLTGQDLGGQTLTPGVYFFSSSANLNGTLTLDFQGLNDVYIVIQTVSTLTTDSGSSVVIINQGINDNVYYQVGSSATLGTNSTFLGDIIASSSVTLNTGAGSTCGSVIAVNGAVTLDSNSITNCSSTGSDVTPATSSISPVPEPGSFVLLATGLAGGAAAFRRRLFP